MTELSVEEVLALRGYVMGDAFDVAHIDTFLAKADAVSMEIDEEDELDA